MFDRELWVQDEPDRLPYAISKLRQSVRCLFEREGRSDRPLKTEATPLNKTENLALVFGFRTVVPQKLLSPPDERCRVSDINRSRRNADQD